MRFLIIDDNTPFREGLSELLRIDFDATDVAEAGSISAARKICAEYEGTFDLILLDHWLPDGHGFDLLKEWLSENPELKAAMLSCCEDAHLMRLSLEAGALGYIPKAITESVLVSAIQLVLAGGIYIPINILAELKNLDLSHNENGYPTLTRRQREVLALIQSGMSNKQIARELGISEATVKAHVTMILKAHNASSRNALTSAGVTEAPNPSGS